MSMIICANMQAHMVPYIVGNLMFFFRITFKKKSRR